MQAFAPFWSYLKFQKLVRKISDPEELLWFFKDSKWCLSNGFANPEDFSVNKLVESGIGQALARKHLLAEFCACQPDQICFDWM